jgi:hypothetical protein
MADRENGGTSTAETMSPAATRPDASAVATRSVRVMGRTFASSRARASVNEIVDVNGRIQVVSCLRSV